MLNANQAQLLQSINTTLVSLRQLEVDYFVSFFANFATVSTIFAAMSSNSLSNIFPFSNSSCGFGWIYIFWIGTFMQFITSVRLVISSSTITVYGPGLALRGPIGSMAKAVDGMVIEQRDTVMGLLYMVFWTNVSVVGVMWATIPAEYTPCSIICTILCVGAMFVWNHKLDQIYHRFYFDIDENTLDFRDTKSNLQYQLKETKVSKNKSKKGKEKPSTLTIDEPDEPLVPRGNETPLFNTSIPAMLSKLLLSPRETYFINEEKEIDKSTHHGKRIYKAPLDMGHAGYIGVKTSDGIFNKLGTWERRYMVIYQGHIYYYKDQNAYDVFPDDPVNHRPLELRGLILTVAADELPIMMELTPDDEDDERTSIVLRCDTFQEAQTWLDHIEHGIEVANRLSK